MWQGLHSGGVFQYTGKHLTGETDKQFTEVGQ